MKINFRQILMAAIILTASGCARTNPFLEDWNTPYGIPDYGKIQEADYIPAIRHGIILQEKEIKAIVECKEAPTFENTIEALDRSGEFLSNVEGVLFNLSESDATPTLDEIVEQAMDLLTDHGNNIYMNPDLFARVKAVYDQKDGLGLTREQQMLLDKTYRAFFQNGIALDEQGQKRMREISKDLAVLGQKFGSMLLAQNNAFAERFGVTISEYPEAMAAETDRARREEMFRAYSSRGCNGGENDTRETLMKIMALRIEKANLLGCKSPAEQILSDKMAHDPQTVDSFLESIMKPALKVAQAEVADMQKVMNADIKAGLLPAGSTIQPWDWAYYADKVRQQKYDLSEDLTRPYFKMENVREGVFSTASRLYGLTFEKVEDAPLYNLEVEVFKVSDADGSLIGIIMTDYFPRPSKRGGAWMNNVRDQKIVGGQNIRPIIVNVGNFAKPTAETPSLLTIDQVETMFHEFGHALHGLLSQCTYSGVSGTSVARDFVELPSQINENWAFQKEVLKGYARHYETGEVIPDELVEKILAARKFNQGFMTTELCAASILDMKWHELESLEVEPDCPYAGETILENGKRLIDPVKFEEHVCRQMGLIDEIIPRYRTTYFNHIFNSGYSAGYYSYLWAEVLDKDAFELFKQNGIFDPETATSFRRNILEMGGREEPMTLYKRFRGAVPDPDALLRARGLK